MTNSPENPTGPEKLTHFALSKRIVEQLQREGSKSLERARQLIDEGVKEQGKENDLYYVLKVHGIVIPEAVGEPIEEGQEIANKIATPEAVNKPIEEFPKKDKGLPRKPISTSDFIDMDQRKKERDEN